MNESNNSETMIEYLERKELEKKQEEQDLVDQLYLQIIGKRGGIKYCPEYIQTLLLHIGVRGKSYKSLAFELGIASVKTLYNWETSFPEWKKAKEVAQSGRLGYIEGLLTGLADGTLKGNAAAAIFYAKNAAPDEFKDKRDIEVSGGGVIWVIDTGIPAKQLPPHVVMKAAEVIETECREITPSLESYEEEEENEEENLGDLL